MKFNLKIRERKSGQKEEITTLIKDGISITRYSDMARANAAYLACRNAKQNCAFTRGVLTQHWEGMSEKQIVDLTLKEFEEMKTKFKTENPNGKFVYVLTKRG